MRTARQRVWLMAKGIPVLFLLLLMVTPLFPTPAQASAPAESLQVERQYVQISSTVTGLLYRPVDIALRSNTAVLVMHPFSDVFNNLMCQGLASRGFQVLCANGRYTGSLLQDITLWDNVALDVKAGMDYLRKQPDVKKVVLLGGSGGGPQMAYYQNVAENGTAVCRDSRKVYPCSDALSNMTPADGIVLRDPILGEGIALMLLNNDPSVLVEDQFGRIDASQVDQSLDMFSVANGYDPVNPTYSPEFVRRFYAAQAARMNRQIELAKERLARVEAGQGMYSDNEPFIMSRHYGFLWGIDRRLVARTRQPHKLLTAKGIRETNVESIRPAGTAVFGDPAVVNFHYGGAGASKSDLRAFLSLATRAGDDFMVTADNITGIDYFSSNSTTPGNLAGVRVPLLIMAATGHYWVVPNEINHEYAGSEDKQLVYLEGATHGFTPCRACERTPGEFDNVTEIALDYIAQWLKDRFGDVSARTWEEQFAVAHGGRAPTGEDMADREWSLTFLAQNGRPPTEAEWAKHYMERKGFK